MRIRRKPEDAAAERYNINPAGVGVAVVGATLLAISAFLPLDEGSGVFARVQSNTMIQHDGWLVLVVAAGAALGAYNQYREGKRGFSTLIMGVVAGIIVAAIASNKDLRTLYPIGADGAPDPTAQGTVVPLGVAVYVAGFGAALTVVGGWIIHKTATLASAGEPALKATGGLIKRCPDCAETVQSAANVCRFCGYRFESSSEVAPAPASAL